MASPKLNYSRRIRATPYTPCVEALGVSGYSVVNHTILPKGFEKSVDEDYWHLKEHVQLWDVGCQRQVELRGPDAAKLTQLMTPRDLRSARVGQCLYAPIIDENAAMLNDPIILKLAEDHFWLSIADSDILLWAKGLAFGMGLDVAIDEPDVWPLAVQGPKSEDLMARVFGDSVRKLGFFWFDKFDFNGRELIVARTGYSKQGGFEIYLDVPSMGVNLWNSLWEAGAEFNVAPGSPNLIERVEGGLLSYGNEMTRENNPLECGMEKYCSFDSVEYIGKIALQRIASEGARQQIRGLLFDGERCPPCRHPWSLMIDKLKVGHVTTAVWSPRFECNVALGMLESGHWHEGTRVSIATESGDVRNGIVTSLPFSDRELSTRIAGSTL